MKKWLMIVSVIILFLVAFSVYAVPPKGQDKNKSDNNGFSIIEPAYITHSRIVIAENIKDRDIEVLPCSFFIKLSDKTMVPACIVFFEEKNRRAVFLTDVDLKMINDTAKVPEWVDRLTSLIIDKMINEQLFVQKEIHKLIYEEMMKDEMKVKEKKKAIA